MSGIEQKDVFARPRDKRTWYWAGDETVDERLERAIRFLEWSGPITTAFGDSDLIFYHDGEKVCCYADREHRPGWFMDGDEAESCLRHQLRLDRDYLREKASAHRLVSVDEDGNARQVCTGMDQEGGST